jgi:hypothetical protein
LAAGAAPAGATLTTVDYATSAGRAASPSGEGNSHAGALDGDATADKIVTASDGADTVDLHYLVEASSGDGDYFDTKDTWGLGIGDPKLESGDQFSISFSKQVSLDSFEVLVGSGETVTVSRDSAATDVLGTATGDPGVGALSGALVAADEKIYFTPTTPGNGLGVGYLKFEIVPEQAVIPEPLTMLAVVGGLGALGGYVRRRRS